MPEEFLRHADVGLNLTQAEWEAVTSHIVENAGLGDMLYTKADGTLLRLPAGAAGQTLHATATGPMWAYPSITFNAKDYGAMGDGISNDIAAIQAAIDAATALPTGGVVYFPAGTYIIQGARLLLKSNTVLLGEGKHNTIFLLEDSGGVSANLATQVLADEASLVAAVKVPLGQAGTLHNFTMRELTIRKDHQTERNLVTIGAGPNNSDSRVTNILIEDCIFSSKSYDANGGTQLGLYGGSDVNAHDVVIRNNHFFITNGAFLTKQNWRRLEFSGNTIVEHPDRNVGPNPDLQEIVKIAGVVYLYVHGNRIVAHSDSYSCMTIPETCVHTIITNNFFDGSLASNSAVSIQTGPNTSDEPNQSVLFSHNVFVGTGGTIGIRCDSPAGYNNKSFVIQNNLLYLCSISVPISFTGAWGSTTPRDQLMAEYIVKNNYIRGTTSAAAILVDKGGGVQEADEPSPGQPRELIGIIIQGNIIRSCHIGIKLVGSEFGGAGPFYISDNHISDFDEVGIYTGGQHGICVHGNYIYNPVSKAMNEAGIMAGIYSSGSGNYTRISENYIYCRNPTTGLNYYGIWVASSTGSGQSYFNNFVIMNEATKNYRFLNGTQVVYFPDRTRTFTYASPIVAGEDTQWMGEEIMTDNAGTKKWWKAIGTNPGDWVQISN